MPTYDYLCGACGEEVEIFHAMTDAPKRKCPSCGRLKLERQIGAGGGIIFKGSGFYETDYRSAEYQKRAKEDKAAAKGKSGDDAQKSESGKSTGKSSGDDASKSSGKSESSSKSA